MIRLIAFDMDGTVLDEHKKILPQTKEKLECAAAQGIELVPATGRPLCGLSPEIEQLQGCVMSLLVMVQAFMRNRQELA